MSTGSRNLKICSSHIAVKNLFVVTLKKLPPGNYAWKECQKCERGKKSKLGENKMLFFVVHVKSTSTL